MSRVLRLRTRQTAASAILACVALAAGCGGQEPGSALPRRGGVLRVGIGTEPDFNPYFAHAAESLYLANRTLPRLAREIMPDETLPGGVVPELASSWEFRDGGRTLAFTLRAGLWSDGQPVTCEDLKFTLKIQTDREIAWRNMGIKRHITGIDCPSPHEALVRFDTVYPTRLMDANDIHVLPRALAAEPTSGWRRLDWASRLPGGGAFKVARSTPGQEIVLVRNPGWYGGPELPRLDGITLRIVPDSTNRMNQLLAGDLDVADNLDPGNAARLAAEQHVTVLRRPGWTFTYIGWMAVDRTAYARYRADREAECTRRGDKECADDAAAVAALARRHPHPLFGDARVRRAMTLAIDRTALVDTLFRGEAEVPPSPILAPLPEHDPALLALPQDLNQARALLAEAGFRDSNGDGTLERDGRPFVFDLAVRAGDVARRQAAVLIQRDLARAGVAVNIEPVENSSFASLLAARRTDAWLGGWQTSLRVDMSEALHSRGCATGSANYGAFSNPDADAIVDQARDTVDDTARAALWRRWEALFVREQPYSLLFRPRRLVGARTRVIGAESLLANDPLNGVETWSLAAAEQR